MREELDKIVDDITEARFAFNKYSAYSRDDNSTDDNALTSSYKEDDAYSASDDNDDSLIASVDNSDSDSSDGDKV